MRKVAGRITASLLCLIIICCTVLASAKALNVYDIGRDRQSTQYDDPYIVIYIGEIPYRVNTNITVGYDYTTHGYEVEVVQNALRVYNNNNPNANCDPGDVDGSFGSNTYNAVINFQSYTNSVLDESMYGTVAVDGIVGRETWMRIRDVSQ